MARKTLSELRTKIRYYLNDTDSTNYETSDNALNEFIKDEYIDLINELGLHKQGNLVKTATVSSVANQVYYEIPDDMICLLHIKVEDVNGDPVELTPTDQKDMERWIQDNTNTNSEIYYWCFEGNYIRIWPVITAAGRTITLKYMSVPTEPVDATELQIPQNWLGILAVRAAILVKSVLNDPIDDLVKLANDKMRRGFKLGAYRQIQTPPRMKSLAEFYPRRSDGGLF